MRNTISLLGLSKTSIAVILDVVKEVFGDSIQVRIYTNLVSTPHPAFPVAKIPYELLHHTETSKIEAKLFFGTASAPSRKNVYNFFTSKHNISQQQFTSVLHPSSYRSSTIELDTGILIEPLSIISSQSRIGFGTFIKRGASIGHHNEIGAFCDINPGAILSGNVKVGEGTIIGTGAVVRDNIYIGRNTVIGAGSVVTKDIPDHAIAYGNPCRVKRTTK